MTTQVLICVAIPLKCMEIGRCPPLILHTGGVGWGGGGEGGLYQVSDVKGLWPE